MIWAGTELETGDASWSRLPDACPGDVSRTRVTDTFPEDVPQTRVPDTWPTPLGEKHRDVYHP